MSLGTSVLMREGMPILRVKGEIDVLTAPLLKQAMLNLVSQGHRHIFIDLTEVRFMDSSGFGALLGATRRLRPEGGALHLFGCNTLIGRMLHLTRLDTILGLYADEEGALAAVMDQDKE